MDIPPTIEGLRHARDLLAKQLAKERQRTADLRRRIEELVEERERAQARAERPRFDRVEFAYVEETQWSVSPSGGITPLGPRRQASSVVRTDVVREREVSFACKCGGTVTCRVAHEAAFARSGVPCDSCDRTYTIEGDVAP